MIVPLLSLEKERSRTALSSLGGWHSERKNSEVISVTQQTVVTLLQKLLPNFTLDRNSMVHKKTNIPAKSVKQIFPFSKYLFY